MKRIALIALLITYAFTGCQKQPEESDTTIPSGKDSADVIKFEIANQKIGHFLEQLDDPETPLELRKKLICKNYPAVYYKEYVPALIELSPEYTSEELKSDLNKVLKFYKEKNNVQC